MVIPTAGFCSQFLQRTAALSAPLRVFRTPWTRQSLHVEFPPIIPTLTTSYVHGTSSTPLLHDTVAEALQKSVERWPDREAMVFLQDGVRKTYAEFQQDVDRAAAGLLALGLRKGDRLGMWGPNTYEWILSQFATAKAGIIQELFFTLKLQTASPKVLPELRSVILLDSRQPGMFHFDDVMQAGDSRHVKQLQDLQKKLSFDDPINIQFTSGTTGAPKGATLSHHNIVNNAYFVGKRVGYTWKPHHRVCVPVPLYHCFGSVGGGIAMAVHGLSLVFPSAGYSGKANLEAMQSERCTYVYGTPTMYIDMLNQPDLAKYDLSSVEGGLVAGAPCPPELVKKVVLQMGIKEMTIGYGTTENSPVTFLGCPLDNMERKSETVGYIIDHTEAKIVNPTTGQIMPLGMKGEIMVRGFCVMLEYWSEQAKTQECITKEGWYRTGDIGSLDAYGYCKIDGRIKDMLIRGGENIYPAEIEQFLHTHPKVKEAQVVGVKDPRMGEEVCACIKLVDGQECTAEEIKAYCKGQIAHFKIPRYVLFMTSFPLTITGKIQKQKLREEVEKQLN
uniref:Medium-chain acyl-CoA ligase ACSF2, mitochondrial n=1 Tax=Xiphophorus couchianus TaxID=32473 RepID=A0A3B5L123_9TELE